MNQYTAETAIAIALGGSLKERERFERKMGRSLSTVLDIAWDWAEMTGKPYLSLACEDAFNHLTGRTDQ